MIRVSVLCSNLGTNCVMRATLLVELLCQEFEVCLVGFEQGSGLWAPARELHLSVHAIPISNALQLGWHALRGDPFRETDALVISKPLPTSLGPGPSESRYAGLPPHRRRPPNCGSTAPRARTPETAPRASRSALTSSTS